MTKDGEKPQPRFTLTAAEGGQSLAFDEPIYVGRVAQAEVGGKQVTISLVVSAERVSRVHARISPTETGVSVEDLKSTNGTFVNDQRVVGQAGARHGDRIRFDVLEYVLKDARPPAMTIPAGAGPKAEAKGTVVRDPDKVEATVDEKDNAGRKGGTVVLQVNRNLPKEWGKSAGTILVSDEDLEKVNAAIDADKLAMSYATPTLLVISGDNSGQPFGLNPAGDISFWNIGSDPGKHDLNIVIGNASVSGYHAKLVFREQRWKIIDQMSTNGTFVNGQRFNVAFLSSKDHVRFGQVECLLLLPAPGTSGRTTNTLPPHAWRWALGVAALALGLWAAWAWLAGG